MYRVQLKVAPEFFFSFLRNRSELQRDILLTYLVVRLEIIRGCRENCKKVLGVSFLRHSL